LIKPLVTRFLQHLTSQNEWSREYLQPFTGKIIAFDFVLAKAHLLILEDGSLALAGDSSGEKASPEANIHAPPSLLLRMMAGDETAKMHIKIDGDAHLATEISKVLQHMRWDIEEDLSKVVGDIAAYKIGEVSKKTFAEAKKQSISAAEMLSEYWQEEKNILTKKRHVETFNANVDALVSDVARFEKRLQKLEKLGAA
jgi:ubiquinone biosynthesis accessory factor UbiJ